MKLQRTARLHQAGTDPVLWWEFMPGDRVKVVEGFLGTVVAVEDGPGAGLEQYVIELDAGMGGGEYAAEELTAVEGTGRAAFRQANSANPGAYSGQPMVPPAVGTEDDDPQAGQALQEMQTPPEAEDSNSYSDQNNPYMAVASDDYPMLSEILLERPPLAHSERVASSNPVPVRIRRAAGYIVEDENGLVVAGPFVSRLDAEAAERKAREEGQTNIVIRRQGAADDGWYEGGAKTSDMYRLRAGKAHYWRDGEPLCGKTDKYGRPPARGRQLGSLVGNACAICDRRLTQEREERIRQMREGMAKGETKPFKDTWWLERFLVPLAEDMIARQPEHLRYDPATGKGPSYDWCRFRRTRRCFYPRQLNEAASDEAGYAVWVPEDRGFCPRDPWEGELGQMSCPVSEPGPHAKPPYRALADATIAWEDGGQRYDANGNPKAASLSTIAWTIEDVRANPGRVFHLDQRPDGKFDLSGRSAVACPECGEVIEASGYMSAAENELQRHMSIEHDITVSILSSKTAARDLSTDEGWYESGTTTMRGQITGKPHYWRDGRPICNGSARYHGKPLREGWYGSYCSACTKKLAQERKL